MVHIPAAAAGSEATGLGASPAGLSRLSGLRVRADSDCLSDGDRDRPRSNRERRGGSGSVWSKRDRFTRRSSSAMVGDCAKAGREETLRRMFWGKKGADQSAGRRVGRRRKWNGQLAELAKAMTTAKIRGKAKPQDMTMRQNKNGMSCRESARRH